MISISNMGMVAIVLGVIATNVISFLVGCLNGANDIMDEHYRALDKLSKAMEGLIELFENESGDDR